MSVYIDKELCKSCKICISICPKDVFELTGHTNKKGYDYVGAPNQENCISCMLCQNSCPDFAIYIEKNK